MMCLFLGTEDILNLYRALTLYQIAWRGMFGLAGSKTGNEYRTLSNYFSFAKTPMRAAPSPALVSSAL